MHTRSCDTFVVLPQLTKDGALIFGKNADRPQGEVQEVIFVKGGQRNDKIKCTYITIDESPEPVNDVILSKPAWMWGAEMGANNKNVVIGNEAVWTLNDEGENDPGEKRLLGMDLLRLGLERGNTAEQSLDIITSLLEQHGQGGPCSEFDDDLCYHNSFLIADSNEAWVLETSGKLWAAERITTGFRNISNGLTITDKIDKCSKDLMKKAKTMDFWDGKSKFNFTKCFSSGGDVPRQKAGERLLREYSRNKTFDVTDMFNVLRDKKSGICCSYNSGFPTQGSQVSLISSKGISVHWFTATPDPSLSYFKPFIFTPKVQLSTHTKSPNVPGWRHHLYELHYTQVLQCNKPNLRRSISDMEEKSLAQVFSFVKKYESGEANIEDVDSLMKESVENEIEIYASELS